MMRLEKIWIFAYTDPDVFFFGYILTLPAPNRLPITLRLYR